MIIISLISTASFKIKWQSQNLTAVKEDTVHFTYDRKLRKGHQIKRGGDFASWGATDSKETIQITEPLKGSAGASEAADSFTESQQIKDASSRLNIHTFKNPWSLKVASSSKQVKSWLVLKVCLVIQLIQLLSKVFSRVYSTCHHHFEVFIYEINLLYNQEWSLTEIRRLYLGQGGQQRSYTAADVKTWSKNRKMSRTFPAWHAVEWYHIILPDVSHICIALEGWQRKISFDNNATQILPSVLTHHQHLF